VILGHSTATMAMAMDQYRHLFSEATWQAMERLPAIPLVETQQRTSRALTHWPPEPF